MRRREMIPVGNVRGADVPHIETVEIQPLLLVPRLQHDAKGLGLDQTESAAILHGDMMQFEGYGRPQGEATKPDVGNPRPALDRHEGELMPSVSRRARQVYPRQSARASKPQAWRARRSKPLSSKQ